MPIKNHISGIYIITNRVNGKVYIGQSKSCTTRFRQHMHTLRRCDHNNPHLQHAYNEYGEDVFEYRILEECPLDKRDERERFWISKYDSMNQKYGYNLQSGGHKNKILSDETKEKIGRASKGNKYRLGIRHTEEHKEIIRQQMLGEDNHFYGRKHSTESIEKISKAKTGIKQTKETNAKRSETMKKLIADGKFTPTINKGNLGKKMSDEARKKMSEAKIGKKQSKETIEKRMKYHRGKITSEETKRKMSEAARGRVVSEETKQKLREINLGKKRKTVSQ